MLACVVASVLFRRFFSIIILTLSLDCIVFNHCNSNIIASVRVDTVADDESKIHFLVSNLHPTSCKNGIESNETAPPSIKSSP